MRSAFRVAVLAALAGTSVAFAQVKSDAGAPPVTATTAAETTDALAAGSITFGTRISDNIFEGYTDALVPLWRPNDGMFFINPRFSANDNSDQESNFGLGYRHYLAKAGVIVGANAYWDHRDTAKGSPFNQFGGGLEILSRWIDFRANYYIPEDKQKTVSSTQTAEIQAKSWTTISSTTEPVASGHTIEQDYLRITKTVSTQSTKLWEQYEQAMEGFDIELGGRLPIPVLKDYMDIGVYGGYYFYNGLYGEDDLEGFKGRLELKLLPALTVEAEVYEDDELYGSDYFIGARLSLPFDPARLAQGRNPFKGAADGFTFKKRKYDLRDRMGDMVMRDLHVQTDLSDVTEVVAARQVSTTTRKKQTQARLTLLSDVNFVDGDNTTGIEDGTAEHPYNTVQEGVANVMGNKNIYVWDSTDNYGENVTLTAGVSLYGSGRTMPGVSGLAFGSGVYPVVDGASKGPAITLADDTTVVGVKVTNTDVPRHDPVIVSFGGNEVDISRVGIYGHNANNVAVKCVVAEGCSIGGIALYDAGGGAKATFTDNTFANNDEMGLAIGALAGEFTSLAGGADTLDLTLEENSFNDNDDNGLFVECDGYDTATVSLTGNEASRNGEGAALILHTTGDATLSVDGLFANDNTDGDGLYVDILSEDGIAKGMFNLVQANGNYMNGIEVCDIATVGGSEAYASFKDIETGDNGVCGMDIDMQAAGPGVVNASFDTIVANGNGEDGVYVGCLQSGDGGVNLTMENITAGEQVAGSGIAIDEISTSGNGPISIVLDGVTASDNQFAGVGMDWVQASAGDIAISINNIVANGSLAGAGVSLDGIETGGNISLTMENVTAGNNEGCGVTVGAFSYDGDLAATFKTITAGGNNDIGLNVTLEAGKLSTGFAGTPLTGSDDLAATFDGITVNDNIGGGLAFSGIAHFGSASAEFMDLVANNNHEHGVFVALEAGNEGGNGSASVDMDTVTANDNNMAGSGVHAEVYAYGGSAFLSLNNIVAGGNFNDNIFASTKAAEYRGAGDAITILNTVQANGSIGEDGIDAFATTYGVSGTAGIQMTDVEADDNFGCGIDFAAAEAAGSVPGGNADAEVNLTRVAGNDNGSDGIWVWASSKDGAASVTLDDCTARDNTGGDGANIYVKAGGAAVASLEVENGVFTGNDSYGIRIAGSGGSGQDLNLGNDANGTAGNNSICGNGSGAVDNSGSGTVKAENNWWGTTTPGAGLFGGSVDHAPWLGSDPNL